MNEDLKSLYNEYSSAGNSESFDEFVEAKSQMGDDAFYSFVNSQIDSKKKVDTNPTTTPNLMDLPPIEGTETNLPVLDISGATTSTDLALTGAESSGESSSQINTILPETTNPTANVVGNESLQNTQIINPNVSTQRMVNDLFAWSTVMNPKQTLPKVKDELFSPANEADVDFNGNQERINQNQKGIFNLDENDSKTQTFIPFSILTEIGQDGAGNKFYTPKNNPDIQLIHKDGQLQLAEREIYTDENGRQVEAPPRIFGRDFRITKNGTFYSSHEFNDKENELYAPPAKLNYADLYTFDTNISYNKGIDILGESSYRSIEDFNKTMKANKDYEQVFNADGTPSVDGDSLVFRIKSQEELDRANRSVYRTNEQVRRQNELNGYTEDQRHEETQMFWKLKEGARISQEEYDKQVDEFGKDIVDGYGGLLSESEMNAERYKAGVQAYIRQGLNEEQATVAYNRDLQLRQEDKAARNRELVDFILGVGQRVNDGEESALNTKFADDRKLTQKERQAWNQIAGHTTFIDFMDEEGFDFFGRPEDNLDINVSTTTLRGRIKDAYIDWLYAKQQNFAIALDDRRGERLRQESVRAVESDDVNNINVARQRYAPIQQYKSELQQKFNSLGNLKQNLDAGFDINYKRGVDAAKEYAGYQNSQLKDTASYMAKSIANGAINFVGDVVGGLMTPFGFNDRAATFINAYDYTTRDPFNILSEGTFDKYTRYQDKDGNQYEQRHGKVFSRDKNGKLTFNEGLTNNQGALSDYKKVDEGEDWNIAGTSRMITNQLPMMFFGSVGARALATKTVGAANSAKYIKNVNAISKFFGKNSAVAVNANLFKTVSGGYSSLIWGEMVAKNNFVQGQQAGLTNQQAYWYGMFQTMGTMAMIHYAPDARYFQAYKGVSKEMFKLISNNKWKEAAHYLSTAVKPMLITQQREQIQENSELALAKAIDLVANQMTGQNNFDGYKFDDFATTIRDTGILMTFISGKQMALRRSGVKMNIDGLSKLQQHIVASQFPDIDAHLDQVEHESWIGVSSEEANKTRAAISEVKKYTSQIPSNANLQLAQTEQVVVSMQKIDNYKRKMSQTDIPSIKEDYQSMIDAENSNIARILSEAKGRTQTTTEQPITPTENAETVTPAEPQQEGVQVETTVTEVEPEQTAVQPTQPIAPIQPNGGAGAESGVNKQESYKIAGETSKQDKNPNAIGDFLLMNSEVGDTITDKNGDGYEITGVNTRKDGTKELIIVPFELINGEKDYNYSSVKLITERNKKDASGLYEFSYTDNKGDRVTETYNYNTKNKNRPTSNGAQTDIDEEFNAQIDRARAGDQEAIDSLTEYGINYGTKGVYRFVSEEEANNIINGERYEGRGNSGRVDVTSSQDVTTASVSDYRVTFNDEFDLYKDDKRTQIKNAELGDGWLDGGYSLSDVKTIEKKNDDGSYSVIYPAPTTQQNNTSETTDNADEDLTEEEVARIQERAKMFEAPEEAPVTEEAPEAETSTPTPQNERSREVIPTSNESYSIVKTTFDDGSAIFEFQNNKTGKIAEPSSKTRVKYLREYFDNNTYPETEIPEGLSNENEYYELLASQSENPVEIASALVTMPKFLDVQGTKEWHIANNLRKITQESYKQWGDSKRIGKGIARAYFLKKDKEKQNSNSIDIVAYNASLDFSEDYGNDQITPGDVVDFIDKYPNGTGELYNQRNPLHKNLELRFAAVTGLPISDQNINYVLGKEQRDIEKENRAKVYAEKQYDKLTAEERNNLANEYDTWFNSLSLEEKEAELIQSYPYDYEQETTGNTQQPEAKSQPANRQGQSNPNAPNKGSTEAGRKAKQNTDSPEYRQVLAERDANEKRYAEKRDAYRRISRQTNQDFQDDQVDLLGERATDSNATLFDERADGNAGKEVIAKAKAEMDSAKADLDASNKKLKDLESGKTGATGSIDFESEPETKEAKRESRTVEKKKSRAVRDEKINAKIDSALDDLLKTMRGKLNAGVDPEVALKGAKVAAAYIEGKIYKLGDILQDLKHKLGDISEDLFDAIKAGYASYRETAPDHIYKNLDANTRDYTYEMLNEPQLNEDVEGFIGRIHEEIVSGDKRLNIVRIRAIAKEFGLAENIKDTTLQEYVEVAIIREATAIAKLDIPRAEKYQKIVELYENQPTISMRSGERIAKQQYSTPIPMSFLAGEFTNNAAPETILEPSAGNGMMIFNIDSEKAIVNEIDDVRRENLKNGNYKSVMNQDARNPFPVKVDAVVMNPPFGESPKKDYHGINIAGLDEQMTLTALESMNDHGTAAIIIGGHNEYNDNGRLKRQRQFLSYLHNYYNVVDIINMDGGLYSRQGTSYPTRMILIAGRKRELVPIDDFGDNIELAPLKDNTNSETVRNFTELYDRVNNAINKVNDENILQRPLTLSGNNNEADTTGTNQRPVSGGNNTDANQQGNQTGREPVSRDTGRDVRESELGEGRERADGPTDGNRSDTTPATESESGENTGSRRGRDLVVPDGGLPPVSSGTDGSRGVQQLAVNLEQEKTPYPAQSKAQPIGSVVPTNMAQPLNNIMQEFDDIDEYVRTRLGYETKEDLWGALSAEQVDGVALAIRQIERGKGFIIGDMTGVGKGRQAAAIIRYAVLQGKKPIFFTEKAGLFSDMYRDLRDIGSEDLVPFIVNDKSGDNDPTITDEEGNVVHKVTPKAEKTAIIESQQLPDNYDYVTVTYSQVNSKEISKKGSFIQNLAFDNIIIMDESHNAGGDSATGEFFKTILPTAQGTVYLSGTFAKRPDNMPVYALKTDISDANMSQEEMTEAIKRAGVPMQEILSRDLVAAGQMIRRERDFTGVTIDWETHDEDKAKQEAVFNDVIEIFNEIIHFQKNHIDNIIADKDEDFKDQQGTVEKTKGTKDLGISNTPFASKTYNTVKQLLFALKAETIAKEAIAELKAGRKPVVAFDNTMESFTDDLGGIGALIDNADFSTTLLRGLQSTLRYTETNFKGEKVHKYIPLDELSLAGQREYQRLSDKIKQASTGIFISPIDIIRTRIEEAGYSVGEMTGRGSQVNIKGDGTSEIVKRENTDKKKLARDFNHGETDVLLLNRSASTGISLHASNTFKDQKQRVMLFAQSQPDVNAEVQMRGRIDRTGQVVRGAYRYIISPIPAEQRLIMMFKAKLKSLDANTTSSQKSKTNEIDVVDFLNKYGDRIVKDFLIENPDLNRKMLDPLKMDELTEEEKQKLTVEDASTKVSGRVALLSVKEQELFYKEVAERYSAELKYMNDTGTNDLEITTVPLNAETKKSIVIVHGKGGESVFGEDSILETVEVDVLRKPMKKAEVDKIVESELDGKSANEYTIALTDRAQAYLETQDEKDEKDIRESQTASTTIKKFQKWAKNEGLESPEEIAKYVDERIEQDKESRIDFVKQRNKSKMREIVSLLRSFKVGQSYLVPSANSDVFESIYSPGIFLGFKVKDKMNPSSIVASFAVLNGNRRIEVPLSKADYLRQFKDSRPIDDWDEQIPTSTRRTSYIVTGNLLQAYASNKGQLITYTTKEGQIKQGIMMPDNFKPENQKMKVSIVNLEGAIIDGRAITDSTGDITISKRGYNGYNIYVPASKSKGGKYFLNEGLKALVNDNDFYQSGNKMMAVIPEHNLTKVLKYLSETYSTTAETIPTIRKENEGPQLMRSSSNFTPVSRAAIDALVDKLKKAFPKAFKNINVTYDLNEATARARKLGVDINANELKTKDGTVYGFKLSDGTIYLNPEKLNANTAFHEFSHLWEQIMPSAWKKGVALFQQTTTGKQLFEQLKREGNYSNLTDPELWSEAMNTHIGNIGEARYQNPRGKMKEFVDWFKQTMAKFLNVIGVKNNFTKETRLAAFTDKVLGDLTGERALTPESNQGKSPELYAADVKNALNNNIIQFSIASNNTPSQLHKNVMPSKTWNQVADAYQNEGPEAAQKVLEESAWYGNLTIGRKAEGLQAIMMAEGKKIAENSKLKEKQKIERLKSENEAKVSEIKIDYKQKIKDIHQQYKSKMAEIKKDTKKATAEKYKERNYWRRQAVNSIKLLLRDKGIVRTVTPTDLIRLISMSEKIVGARDFNKAFDEFADKLDAVITNAEKRIKKQKIDAEEKAKMYAQIEANVKSMVDNGETLADIEFYYPDINQRQLAINAFHKFNNENMKDGEAVRLFDVQNQKEDEMLNKKLGLKERLQRFRRKFAENTFDRQWLPKKMLDKIGAKNTENFMINMAGASNVAKEKFNNAYDKIFYGLNERKKTTLFNVIQAMRTIAIDKNRAERGLAPIAHPEVQVINAKGEVVRDANGNIVTRQMNGVLAQKYLNDIKQKLGDKEFNELTRRANDYFGEFRSLLDMMLEEGLINQESYDAMIDIDYQPRLFLEHLLDYQEDSVDFEDRNFMLENGGLSKDLIRSLDEGSTGVLLSNAELLLATALTSRYRAKMTNEMNREFMEKEFPKAKLDFENITDAKKRAYDENLKAGKVAKTKEENFYRYFKELQSKIINNPIIGNKTDSKGNVIPKYKYDAVPNKKFKKAYYFVDGIRHEFFMEADLHAQWHDTIPKAIDPSRAGKIRTFSGSAIVKFFATGNNPAFVVVNTPRDFVHTLMFSDEYSPNIIWSGMQLFKDSFFTGIKEIAKYDRGKDSLLDKYLEYGGGMEWLNTQGMLKKDSQVSKFIDATISNKNRDMGKKIFNGISLKFLSRYSEIMFRVGIFDRSIQNQLKEIQKLHPSIKTIDDIPTQPDDNFVDKDGNHIIQKYIYAQAVRNARSIMDFNQGGTAVKDAENFIPYINAATQGSRVALQQFKRRPAATTAKVFQLTTYSTIAMYGMAAALIAAFRDDDDEEKNWMEIYLDFLRTVSPKEKEGYWVIPYAYGEDAGTYKYIRIAKSQALTPVLNVTEAYTQNWMRKSLGQKELPHSQIWREAMGVMSDNLDPIGLSGIGLSATGGNLDEGISQTASIVAKNPFIKGLMTYASGYDFFFNQPLQDTQNKTYKPLEGARSSRVEEFYKSIGINAGLSPIRTKAMVEGFITMPSTNPYIGLVYGALDAMTEKGTIKDAAKKFTGFNEDGEWKLSKSPIFNRAARESTTYGRQLNVAREIKNSDEYKNALMIDGQMKVLSDDIAKRYDNISQMKAPAELAKIEKEVKAFTTDDVITDKIMKRIKNKIENKDMDTTVWDIAYDTGSSNEAKAILIYSYYGDVRENEKIKADLKEARVWSKNVRDEYDKILKKYGFDVD